MTQLILSAPNQHYWNNNGAQQQEMDRLTKKFMPTSGCAENFTGEVVRAINRLYYEFCNNGNCNALDCETTPGEWVECSRCGGDGYIREEYDDGEVCEEECPDCGGEGGYYEEDEEEYSLNKFFGNFIELIRQYFEKKNCKEGIEAIDDVQRVIENNCNTEECNISKYDKVVDYVIWLVLNDEDNKDPIPEWYAND
jgi:hypothetical protein